MNNCRNYYPCHTQSGKGLELYIYFDATINLFKLKKFETAKGINKDMLHFFSQYFVNLA